jgi:hypothetical protein
MTQEHEIFNSNTRRIDRVQEKRHCSTVTAVDMTIVTPES